VSSFCRQCLEERPLDQFRGGKCEECYGEEWPAIDCPERATIRAKLPHVTDDDVRAYHLYGRPERDRSPEERRWLADYAPAAPIAPELPDFVDGHHVGEVGKRCDLTVTVLNVHEFEPGHYGQRFLVRMVAECGANVVWFTGENLALDDGVTYRVRATIREHIVYQGRRQTVVARVTVVEEADDRR